MTRALSRLWKALVWLFTPLPPRSCAECGEGEEPCDDVQLALEAEMTDWQPIETAPKDGSCFLAVWSKPRDPVFGVVWWEDGDWHEYDYSRVVGEFSYWAPLPAPPARFNAPDIEE